MGIQLLAGAYFFVTFFYFIAGILLLIAPHFIERHVPILFPLLHSFGLTRTTNAINLIVMSIVLFVVSVLLVHTSFIGLYAALIFSLWEVYLSYALYFKKSERLNALGHFIIHVAIALFVGYALLSLYASTLSMATASVIGVFGY